MLHVVGDESPVGDIRVGVDAVREEHETHVRFPFLPFYPFLSRPVIHTFLDTFILF